MKSSNLNLTLLLLATATILTPIVAISITQYSKEELTDYIGNASGTNWVGYEEGELSVYLDDNGKTIITNTKTYTATNLIIPDKVELDDGKVVAITTINDSAFYENKTLKGTITFPSKLEEIGQSAFHYCTKLTGKLIIPDKVTNVGTFAFGSCDFSELVISNIQTLNNSCFCSSLTTIVLKGFNSHPDWFDELIFININQEHGKIISIGKWDSAVACFWLKIYSGLPIYWTSN